MAKKTAPALVETATATVAPNADSVLARVDELERRLTMAVIALDEQAKDIRELRGKIFGNSR